MTTCQRNSRSRTKAANSRCRETNELRQKSDGRTEDCQELWNQVAVTTVYGSPWQWHTESGRGRRWFTATLQKRQTAVLPLDWLSHTDTQTANRAHQTTHTYTNSHIHSNTHVKYMSSDLTRASIFFFFQPQLFNQKVVMSTLTWSRLSVFCKPLVYD